MLDIKHLIENSELYRKSIQDRFVNADIDELVRLYNEKNSILQDVESLKRQRNQIAKQSSAAKTPEERVTFIQQGKDIKNKIAVLETQINQYEQSLEEEALRIPNLYHPDAPIGKEDKNNLVIKTEGTPTKFSFVPKDHIELGQALHIIDFETATEITGPKFYYLKNQAVLLELALLRFGIDILQVHEFEIFTTPDLARLDIINRIGFNPRGAESNIYSLEEEGLGLIGTAEITLGSYYANTVLPAKLLPIKMAGISHCFRKEAGAAGQFSKGLYRVHQFTKLEMFCFTLPEESEKMHKQVLAIEEEIYKKLEIPYRVVDTCTGDLGNPAYRKYDLEAWMPGRGNGEYGEITSASNCTDYQAKRLKTRTLDKEKNRVFPHMLNGTAIAISRTLVAIIENFQQEDGSVCIPTALVPYCGFDKIPTKSNNTGLHKKDNNL